MKCFVAVVLLALFAVAFAAETPVEPEKIEQVANLEGADLPRDKRGVLLSYNSPLTYASYASPISYAAGYSLPYAYRTSYPYYYNSYYLR